jgi:DNA invertase Pin-like site-specific DNA recombinase
MLTSNDKPRIALYARVSTDGQTHASQLREVRSYLAKHWPNAQVTEYFDKVTGARFSSKGLDAMMREVRGRRVDIVICYKLDRLGRSAAHLCMLLAELEACETALVVTSQGIDTSPRNPTGRLHAHILAAFAEFERDVIVERIKAGQAAARARGGASGGGSEIVSLLWAGGQADGEGSKRAQDGFRTWATGGKRKRGEALGAQ